MSMTLDNKDYQKRSRERRKAAGGSTVSIVLQPEETLALENLKRKLGKNARDCIGTALLALDKRTRESH